MMQRIKGEEDITEFIEIVNAKVYDKVSKQKKFKECCEWSIEKAKSTNNLISKNCVHYYLDKLKVDKEDINYKLIILRTDKVEKKTIEPFLEVELRNFSLK